MILCVYRNIKQHNCFQHHKKNIEQLISILEQILNDHVTLKTGVIF